jgi:predicted NAD-dependent protein-ADP-ribosyltransferase YbiA (DUF1768 family)
VAARGHLSDLPSPIGVESLRIDYPREVEHGGTRYPSVHHAFWALSVADPAAAPTVAAEPDGSRAEALALALPRRPDWSSVQLAVMTALLRAKYAQHTDLAQVLPCDDAGPGSIPRGRRRAAGVS